MDLNDLSDEALCKQASKDAIDVLLIRHKELVRFKARTFFIFGADKEDVIQEGMIGLFKSIIEYDPSKGSKFKTFAEICIQREMMNAIKKASRQKHMPLNSYVSLSNTEDSWFNNLIADLDDTPEGHLMFKETLDNIELSILNDLTQLERMVLDKFMQGYSYIQIAQTLNKPVRSVDNALQRVKRKIKKRFEKA